MGKKKSASGGGVNGAVASSFPLPPPRPPLSPSSSTTTTANYSNRNTLFLLLLLFIAVLVAVLVARSHQTESHASNPLAPAVSPIPSPSPDDSHGADTNTPPPQSPPPPTATPPLPPTDTPPLPPPVSSPPSPPLQSPTWVPDLVVAQDGTGNFTKIADAVAAAPDKSARRFTIYVRAGVYHENVSVSDHKINLLLVGDGKNVTVLTSDHSKSGGWGTSDSATLAVMGDGFMAQHMTIENTAGPDGSQAVALLSKSNHSAFYECAIIGYQDTLYSKSNLQFYRDCDIYGTVDFIFGRATAVFQNCNLYARKPTEPGQTITFTAQGRDSNHDVGEGFSIHNCTFTAAPEPSAAAPATFQAYLGRPWKEYARTVVMQSYLGDIIDPIGWLAWNQSFANTLDYEEYDNRGPGADTAGRVKWAGFRVIGSARDAAKFTVSQFIDGDSWLPALNIPYVGGLI